MLENNYDGTFITLEGLDGCGKTTVQRELCERLRQRFIMPMAAFEPTQFITGNWVRGAMEFKHVPEETIFFALLADRAYNNANRIRPALENGRVVLCDRYADSTRAYQYDVFGDNRVEREFVEKAITRTEIVPDLTLYLNVTPETAMERNGGSGRYEDSETLEEVYDRYDELWEQYDRIQFVDAEQSIEEVVDKCEMCIEDELEVNNNAN